LATFPGAVEFDAALRAGHTPSLEEMAPGHADTAFLQYTGGTTGVAKGEEIFVCPLPLYLVYALSSSLVFMKIGALTILAANPRDVPAFIHDLKKQPFTAIIGVNTLYRALLDAPGAVEVDTRSLKLANAGGMAVQLVVDER
jgi:long-chain acyl-CoA synthetase